MARNNSFIRLEGTLDGLTFYRKNGESFVKTKNRVSKNRIMNDPAYARTRENMQEFGGAAKCSKSFRTSFAGISRLVSDSYLNSRITGKFRRIVGNGAGLRGQRTYDIVNQVTDFIDFNFNIDKPFDSNFNAPSGGPMINASRDSITWDIPDFNTDTYIEKPLGATHFKLALAAGYTSNYEWDTAVNGYVPVEEVPDGAGVVTYSSALTIGGMVGSATSLTADLTAYAPIPATTALFGATGIVFFQEVNGDLYPLAQGHSMKIAVGG
ncbi:hypothetical protein [Winogradskyella vidalii]|uniref:hypothetical protein n=1 Tax=Winogradskyella vidalii TaxID=2615024 RepID=UPI0015CD15F8|nr:hypothetical protein [Winogradskyella vidalii]